MIAVTLVSSMLVNGFYEADSGVAGHSDFSTMANIYAHLDAQSTSSTADAMLRGLGFASPEDSSPE